MTNRPTLQMSKCLEYSYGGTVVLNVMSMEVRYTAWKEEGDPPTRLFMALIVFVDRLEFQ